MRHVYVHVPFCARRCVYCDFAIAVRRVVPAERYVDAVVRERGLRADRGEWRGGELETFYLGGGTPSLLREEPLVRLVAALLAAERRSPGSDIEITLEANPDDVTPARARAWVGAGINRVSLGAQSFHGAVLEWMHRTHGPDATPAAVRTLRAAGVAAISLDLIFGLPGELGHDFAADLDRALALKPEHLSVYGLTVEAGTAFARWVAAGAVRPVAAGPYATEFLLADRTLSGAGYEHYEVSNYARAGHRARHNSAYWTGRPYGGLGPSAHSFTGGVRSWNVAHWAAYERAVAAGDATAGRERPSAEQRRVERMYLGLRTAEGAALEDLCLPPDAPPLRDASARGWLEVVGSRVRLTAEGWLRLDQLALWLAGAGASA